MQASYGSPDRNEFFVRRGGRARHAVVVDPDSYHQVSRTPGRDVSALFHDLLGRSDDG